MWLTAIVFLPAVGALLIALLPRENVGLTRAVALLASLATLGLGVGLFFAFDPGQPGMQLIEEAPWIPALGVSYKLGVDGISLLLVLLTVVIVPLLLVAPWGRVEDASYKPFAALVLLLETAVLGVFLALDLVLFYVFWEAMLIPMYFLIGLWGGERRAYAAIKFFLYTMAASVLMLVAIVVLYVAAGLGTFDLMQLQGVQLGRSVEFWLFLAFVAAFAVKVPVWPLHSWLPDAYAEAPFAGTVLLSALMSKAGLYGLIRFGWTLFPNAAYELAPWLLSLALVGLLYGALVATVQRDLKRMVAYSSLSHLGLVALGIFAFGPLSLAGSVLQMVNHGIYIAALFLSLAVLWERFARRNVDEFGGVMRFMPRFAALFLVFMLASVALPGTNGFVGEVLILLGTFLTPHKAYAVVAALIAVLSAIYMLWMTQRVFHNPPNPELEPRARDLSIKEVALLVPLALLILGIGIYPKPLLARVEPSVEALIAQAQSRLERVHDPQAQGAVVEEATP